MKPMTIKSVKIGGFRGFNEPQLLYLGDQSVIVYGDNGTGKSSITDAVEWFFHAKVEHLSGNEIDKDEAYHNVFGRHNEGKGFVELTFFDPSLDSRRDFALTPAKAFSNPGSKFNEFRAAAESERISLRYRDLGRFVLAKPADRTKELQTIIGFGEVFKLRKLLRETKSRLAREADARHIEERKAQLQREILETLGQNAHTVEQFLSATSSLVKDLNLEIDHIDTLKAVEEVLAILASQFDSSTGAENDFLGRTRTVLEQALLEWNSVRTEYTEYYGLIQGILEDPASLGSLEILGLLRKGLSVIEKVISEGDICPLCQQAKEKSELIFELRERIDQYQELEDTKMVIDEKGQQIIDRLESITSEFSVLLRDGLFAESNYVEFRGEVESAKDSLQDVIKELEKGISIEVCSPENLPAVENQLRGAIATATGLQTTLEQIQSDNQWFTIHGQIDRSLRAFREYLKINREQKRLRSQCRTFTILHDHLAEKQEAALNEFFAGFSTEINDYYTTINPGEEIDRIALTPMTGKDGEFSGVTLQYCFAGKTRTQPVAHLSESHLNCLGLAFFLAAVKAFNERTRFFVLDDIVAGFDNEHRERLADLLLDKFRDYQVILLTHNREFYDSVQGKLEESGWRSAELTWTSTAGTSVEGCQF